MQRSLIAEKKIRSPDRLPSLPVTGPISLAEHRYHMAEAHRMRAKSLMSLVASLALPVRGTSHAREKPQPFCQHHGQLVSPQHEPNLAYPLA